MTRCDRCNGCFHWEPPDWGEPEQPKCINCGHRPMNVNVPLPERKPDGRAAANSLRGYRGMAENPACARGHVFTPATTYLYEVPGTGRQQRKCKVCVRMRYKRTRKVAG